MAERWPGLRRAENTFLTGVTSLGFPLAKSLISRQARREVRPVPGPREPFMACHPGLPSYPAGEARRGWRTGWPRLAGDPQGAAWPVAATLRGRPPGPSAPGEAAAGKVLEIDIFPSKCRPCRCFGLSRWVPGDGVGAGGPASQAQAELESQPRWGQSGRRQRPRSRPCPPTPPHPVPWRSRGSGHRPQAVVVGLPSLGAPGGGAAAPLSAVLAS